MRGGEKEKSKGEGEAEGRRGVGEEERRGGEEDIGIGKEVRRRRRDVKRW